MRTLTFFQACFNEKGLCLFYDSAYMGQSTPITAFGSILILCLHNTDTLNICMKEFGSPKSISDKIAATRTYIFLGLFQQKAVKMLVL